MFLPLWIPAERRVYKGVDTPRMKIQEDFILLFLFPKEGDCDRSQRLEAELLSSMLTESRVITIEDLCLSPTEREPGNEPK
jgi:hypothetical protein